MDHEKVKALKIKKMLRTYFIAMHLHSLAEITGVPQGFLKRSWRNHTARE